MSPKLLLIASAAILTAAATVLPTVGPPVTGSMYNGNNLAAPKLTDPADLAPVVRTEPDFGGAQAKPSPAHGASHGGAG